MPASNLVLQFLACEKVLDEGVEGHALLGRASKPNKPNKLTGAICKPLEPLNSGPTQLIAVAAERRQDK